MGSFEDGTIVEWAFSNQGEILKEYLGHKGRVGGMVIIGKELVTGGHDGTIRRWQLGVRLTASRMARHRQCTRLEDQ